MQLILTILLLASLVVALPHTASTPVKRATGVLIKSARRPDKCLGTVFIRGARPTPGIRVDLVDCIGGQVLLWDIERGAGRVAITGLGLVLDAGYTPGNFGYLTVSIS
jgi:hypothetical protein